jgi:hypothetical protein
MTDNITLLHGSPAENTITLLQSEPPVLDISAVCGSCEAYAPIGHVHGRCGRPADSGRGGSVDCDARACRLYRIRMIMEASP